MEDGGIPPLELVPPLNSNFTKNQASHPPSPPNTSIHAHWLERTYFQPFSIIILICALCILFLWNLNTLYTIYHLMHLITQFLHTFCVQSMRIFIGLLLLLYNIFIIERLCNLSLMKVNILYLKGFA